MRSMSASKETHFDRITTGRCRRPTQVSLPKTMGETSDGLVETGGRRSNEMLEGPILGVDSPQTRQTPV